MKLLSSPLKIVITAVEAIIFPWLIILPATGANLSFPPLYQEIQKYETTIDTNGDIADIYYPVIDSVAAEFPIALFLQGALLDKAEYTNYAQTVASYGFVVVVPNHIQSFPEFGVTGLFSEVSQIEETLTYLKRENVNPTSRIKGILNTETLSLLGHSFGGAVGLNAIGNYCLPFLCNEIEFTLPEEVVAGVFYGAFLRNFEGEFLPLNNQDIPLALISGSRDGVSTPEEILASYQLIDDPPKALITIEGANHYGITNEDNLRDPVRPTLEPDVANETLALWTSLFLRANVLGDDDAADLLYRTGDSLDDNVSIVFQTKSTHKK
ncbi:MAG: alpha/beta hydrolase family protein [Xenococcus sp. (in: cyanobacteria)]